MITRLDEIESSARERMIPVIADEAKEVLINTVKQIKPKRILEIGTAIGYSGSVMLSYCDKDTYLDTIEIDINRFEEAKQNFAEFGLDKNVNCYLGDAMEILNILTSQNKYDLIFIDGPKSKYPAYLEKVEKSLNKGGIIFCDNVLFRGMVMNGKKPPHKHRTIVTKLREFMEIISQTSRYDTQILEKGDGIAIIKVLQ